MLIGLAVPKLAVYDREAFLLDAVRGKRILSVGLGGYSDPRSYSFHLQSADLTKTLSGKLAEAAASSTFVDLSSDAIREFEPKIKATYHELDITSDFHTWPAALQSQKFDVVILGEVLEHLDNAGAALRNLAQLRTEQGSLIITVPNAYAFSGIVKMFFRVENTHPEHTCHFSYLTIKRLFAMANLNTTEIFWHQGTKSRPRKLMQFILQGASRLMSRLFPQFSLGIIVVSKP